MSSIRGQFMELPARTGQMGKPKVAKGMSAQVR